MNNPLESFYHKQEEHNKSCFLALRHLILQYDQHFNETLKYGSPCFLYKKKICCYLWKDKKSSQPYILFADGNLLSSDKLISGKRKRMKILPIDPNADLPVESLYSILQEAISLYQ